MSTKIKTPQVDTTKIMDFSTARSKTINITRDGTAASGNVSYTGVGFRPRSLRQVFVVPDTMYHGSGHTDQNGASSSIYQYASNLFALSDALASYSDKNNWAQYCSLYSFDEDGFTLTWAKVGSPPAGTIYLRVICYR